MPTCLRAGRVTALAFVTFAAALAAEEALPKTSPFNSTTAAAPTTATPGEPHEFAAISTVGKKTTVNIYDRAAKKGRWIAVGETVDGITVRSFDPAREEVTIRIGATPEKRLRLRQASAVASSGIGATNTPQAPLPIVASAAVQSASEPVLIAPAGAAPATPPTQPPPPVPGSIAHQEQEARMLVSDLLEIGIAQRKAYEEAQRKAAEAAKQAAANRPPTAPQPPPPAKH